MIYLARNKSYLLCIFAFVHCILYAHGSDVEENEAQEARFRELQQFFESQPNVMQVSNLPNKNAMNRYSGASTDSDAPSTSRSTSSGEHVYEDIRGNRNSQYSSENEYENVRNNRESDSSVGTRRKNSLGSKSSKSSRATSPIYAKLNLNNLRRHRNVSSLNSPEVIPNPHAVLYEDIKPYQLNANRTSDSRRNSIRSQDRPLDFSNSKLVFDLDPPPSTPINSFTRGYDEVPVNMPGNPLRRAKDSRKESKTNYRSNNPPPKPPRSFEKDPDFRNSMFHPENYENGTGDVVEMNSRDAAYVRANLEATPMRKRERLARKLKWDMGGDTPREPKLNFLTGEDENEVKGFWALADRMRQKRLRKKAEKSAGPPDYSDRWPCDEKSQDQDDTPDSLSPGHKNRRSYKRNKSQKSNASYEDYKRSSGVFSPVTPNEDPNQGVYENDTNRNSKTYMRQNSVAPATYYNPSTGKFSSSGSDDDNHLYQNTGYEYARKQRPRSIDSEIPDAEYLIPSGQSSPVAPDEDHSPFQKAGSGDEVSQKSSRSERSDSHYSYYDPVVVAYPGYVEKNGQGSMMSEGKKKKGFKSFFNIFKPRPVKAGKYPRDKKYYYVEYSDDESFVDESSTRETKEYMRKNKKKKSKSKSSRASSAHPSRSVSEDEYTYSTLEDDTPKGRNIKQRFKNFFSRKSQSDSPPLTPTTPKLAIDDTTFKAHDIQKNTEEEFDRLKLELREQEASTTA